MVMNRPEASTEYRQQLKSRILKEAAKQFLCRGIKAVKMDEIANNLSISKRTLYEIYENKERLLMACVQQRHFDVEAHMEAFKKDNDKNVIDIILEFYRAQLSFVPMVNPLYFAEVHKYPEVVKWLAQRHQHTDKESLAFFQKGVEEGLFRPDVNFELINVLGSACMNYIMSNKLYETYDMKDLFTNVIMLFVRGFCTAKGVRILEERL